MLAAENSASRLEHDIRTAIVTGAMRPHQRLRSCRDFAREYSLTYSRVQRVVKRLEREGLLRSEHGGGTYVQAARQDVGVSLALVSASQAIATVVTPGSALLATVEALMPSSSVIRGAEAVLGRQQLRVRVVMEEEVAIGALDNLDANESRTLVGIVVGDPTTAVLREAARRGSQVILVAADPVHASWATVIDSDAAAGVRQAVEHLVQAGHRRIAFLGYHDVHPYHRWWSELREAAYREAMNTAGLKPVIDRLSFAAAQRSVPAVSLDPEFGAAIDAWLDAMVRAPTGAGATACICAHDTLAQYLVLAAERLGMRLPADLSVIGYDDLPWTIAHGLTTIHRPYHEAGEIVAELALRAWRHPDFAVSGRLGIRPGLKARASVAPPRR